MQFTKRALWTVAFGVALLVAATILIVRLLPGSRAAQPKSAPSIPVTTAAVAVKDVPFRLYAIGNVEPYTSVALKARVDGQIVGVRFKEGDLIRKGAIMFEIDPRPFVANLDQAKANRAKDQAQLERAKTQDARYQDLLAQKFISPDAYEQVKATLKTAEAAVRADDAAIETSALQLEFATIRAPIDGYAGRIMIQQGNLVKANDTNPLVTLNQIVPVYSSFSVPEQNLAQIRQHQAAGDLVVQATLPNTSRPPVAGRLSFIDNSADTTTGTIKLKAEFANADTALWPGQFVNVVLTLYHQNDAIVVPSVAVQSGPNGAYVFVVKSDQTVEIRNIKVARSEGDDAVVERGLSPGEQVVMAGQLRLAPGSKVTIGGGQAS